MSLNSEIKTIISSLEPETIYLRAATLNEANVSLPRIELTNPIAIHAALPSINNTQTLANVTRLIPVEVLFLKKNTTQDDTGEQIDAILDEMLVLADQFFDKLSRSSLLDPTQEIEEYTLDAVPGYQFSDEILTGWHLQLEFPEMRKVYYCPDA